MLAARTSRSRFSRHLNGVQTSSQDGPPPSGGRGVRKGPPVHVQRRPRCLPPCLQPLASPAAIDGLS